MIIYNIIYIIKHKIKIAYTSSIHLDSTMLKPMRSCSTQPKSGGSDFFQVLCHETHQDAPEGWQGERAKEDQLRGAIQPCLGHGHGHG